LGNCDGALSALLFVFEKKKKKQKTPLFSSSFPSRFYAGLGVVVILTLLTEFHRKLFVQIGPTTVRAVGNAPFQGGAEFHSSRRDITANGKDVR